MGEEEKENRTEDRSEEEIGGERKEGKEIEEEREEMEMEDEGRGEGGR